MTATNHTEHYGLSQYAQDDHPTYIVSMAMHGLHGDALRS